MNCRPIVFCLLGLLPDLLLPQEGASRPPEAPPADPVAAQAQASNAFAWELLRQLGAGNQLLAPQSLRSAFAMTLLATEGASREQIERVIGFAGPAEQVQAGMAGLQQAIEATNGQGVQLHSANRLWGSDAPNYFESTFLDAAMQHYAAGVGRVDFAEADAARQMINEWSCEQTGGKIEELLPPGAVTPRTVLVLSNAVHFRGAWQDPFDSGETRKQPFHVTADHAASVPFMRRGGTYSVARTQGCTAVALPYKGGKLRMLVMLPDSELSEFVGAMTSAQYAEIGAALRPEQIRLSLPRFQLEQQYGLHTEVLPAMGMRAPFQFRDDWRPLNGGKEELRISGVFHSATINVDELGTEAAAATAIVVGKRSLERAVAVDRPFLFAIECVETGQILFVGQVTNPAN